MQDSKQIDELFRLMDAVCENGDAALPALEQYLQTQTDAPEIDTEASLKSSRPTIGNFSSSRTAGGGCATAFLLSRRLFSPQEPYLHWLPDTIRSTMQRCGVRKHSAFIGMIFLRRKTERSSIILMVHGMIALICRIMTMKRILRCPRIILLQ